MTIGSRSATARLGAVSGGGAARAVLGPVPLPEPTAVPALPHGLGLVAVDLDGTLLDPDGHLPAGLDEMVSRLVDHDVLLVPASGRQYATVAHQLADVQAPLTYIAENGAYVVRDGVELSSAALADDVVLEAIARLRAASAGGADLGVVLCGKRSAYVERADDAFLDRCRPYYRALQVVDSLDEVLSPMADQWLKIAVYDFEAAERSAAVLDGLADARVVVSNVHWMDVMAPGVDKGVALAQLQERLGIGPERTVVFGDYLNDLEMLGCAEASFAMANAHPEILAAARHVAPSNAEAGVVQVLTVLLDQLDQIGPLGSDQPALQPG